MYDLEKKNSLAKAGNEIDIDSGNVVSLDASNIDIFQEGSVVVEETRLLRKIDLCLMPLLTISYMLQFLDKQSLNFSSIMGILKDLHLVGRDYAWASSVFYFGYLAFSYPASFLMVRLPLGRYLAGTCIIWAAIICCHAATTSFVGLVVARFFLGVAEASISPGFSLITGMWYKREEQPFRHGIWFFGNSIATMFGGLFAYGIAHITGSLPAWKWLYIILGLTTLAWSIVLVIFLPDSPAQARFLSPEQRVQAVDRIRASQTGMKDNTFKWKQAWEAVTDIKVWLLVLYQLANSIPNGAVTSFSSLVLSGFGFDEMQVYLLQIPYGAFHGMFAIGSTYACSRFKGSRCFIASCLGIISLVGSLLVRYGPNQGSKLFGLWIFVAYASGIPISLSMISSNVAGFTKKAVVSAMLFIAYCVGNIIGPFLFFPDQAPIYESGFEGTTICFGLAFLLILALRFTLMLENKKRDKVAAAAPVQSEEQRRASIVEKLSLLDRTDGENKDFRYVL